MSINSDSCQIMANDISNTTFFAYEISKYRMHHIAEDQITLSI